MIDRCSDDKSANAAVGYAIGNKLFLSSMVGSIWLSWIMESFTSYSGRVEGALMQKVRSRAGSMVCRVLVFQGQLQTERCYTQLAGMSSYQNVQSINTLTSLLVGRPLARNYGVLPRKVCFLRWNLA